MVRPLTLYTEEGHILKEMCHDVKKGYISLFATLVSYPSVGYVSVPRRGEKHDSS